MKISLLASPSTIAHKLPRVTLEASALKHISKWFIQLSHMTLVGWLFDFITLRFQLDCVLSIYDMPTTNISNIITNTFFNLSTFLLECINSICLQLLSTSTLMIRDWFCTEIITVNNTKKCVSLIKTTNRNSKNLGPVFSPSLMMINHLHQGG